VTRRAAVPAPILTVDVGGSHVKVLASNRRKRRRCDSGPSMTAQAMVKAVRGMTEGWAYRAIAIGYPGLVVDGRIVTEPHNLGEGWIGFDFAGAFECPVRICNDAAMQALGSYRGGRLLFLGLGTGLGAAFVVDGAVRALELAHLPYRKGNTYEHYLGERGLHRMGRAKWQKHVLTAASRLRTVLEPDDAVLGGGNVKRLDQLPAGFRRGNNADAFTGGFRLWRGVPAHTA
jgi:predicted NBD/HSP70 family sugar kinase